MAEFIVASAIDVLKKPREEWDAYDLETKNGLKIEINTDVQGKNEKKISELTSKIDEYENLIQRIQADFYN